MLKVTINQKLNFTPNYFTKMIGCVHKWLGENNLHDKISLYVFSHIRGDAFYFNSFDNNLIEQLKKGIIQDQSMFYDYSVVKYEDIKIYTTKDTFFSLSPFLVKDNSNHLIYKDAEQKAKEILRRKADVANVDLGDFNIEFTDFKKTKLIKIHDINNKCFVARVKLTGNETFKKFAVQVGIGNNTGAGFGCIY